MARCMQIIDNMGMMRDILFCTVCKQKVRRPVDHPFCIGSRDKSLTIKIKEVNPDITQELEIPKELLDNND